MGGLSLTLLLILVVLAVLFLTIVGIYNQLVQLKNRYQNAFSQIEVQLKRRHDLIPNLVEIAKGYMKHERQTLEEVVQARRQAEESLESAKRKVGDPASMDRLATSEGLLTGALGRLFAVAEAYPDLKANQNMLQLSEEMTSTENRVAFSRQAYNDAVMRFNTYKQSFPAIMLAGFFGYGQDAGLLDFESPEINEVPKVSF